MKCIMEMLLTIEQAATRLQLHPETVRRQIKRGLMRGIKRGRVWRVPESALEEAAPLPTPSQLASYEATLDAESIWQQMTSGKKGDHNAAIMKMATAPADVRAIIAAYSAKAAAAYYATPEGEAELADWRAVSDPVHDDGGDYYTAEEEAEFRARKAEGTAR